jgi:hypothetical protein
MKDTFGGRNTLQQQRHPSVQTQQLHPVEKGRFLFTPQIPHMHDIRVFPTFFVPSSFFSREMSISTSALHKL